MNRDPQSLLWHWCYVCGRPLLPDPFAYDLVEEHKPCTWAALRWHPDMPAEVWDYARQDYALQATL